MEKSTGKTLKWAKKMDQYYENVQKKELTQDLSKVGFKVHPKRDHSPCLKAAASQNTHGATAYVTS